MTKKEFSIKILRCSYGLWRAVLVGERNLGYKRAQTAAKVLDTSCDIWMDPERLADRREAWKNFGGR